MKKELEIKKQIQMDGFIIHTDEITPFPLERIYRVYPKLETMGYIRISFDTMKQLSEKKYGKAVLKHFKKCFEVKEK